MENLKFDCGMQSFKINGKGALRFNPGDPNVYARFMEGEEKLRQVEQQLTEAAKDLQGEDAGTAAVKLLGQADAKMKEILNGIFGAPNDFHQLLEGVNLLAVAGNGERVVTNLFAALQPVMVEGAKRCAGAYAEKAARQAQARRQSQ